jgi:CheY-like chemotaxis protein
MPPLPIVEPRRAPPAPAAKPPPALPVKPPPAPQTKGSPVPQMKAPPVPQVKRLVVSPVSTSDTKGAHSILVVDDDEATRRLLVRALRTVYTVYEAVDGEEAASMLDAHPGIDCVVSDIMMPRLTGTELAKKMRIDPRLRNIPVLFVTAKKEASDLAEGLGVGARHYLRKPFKLRDLLEKVESVFPKAGRR